MDRQLPDPRTPVGYRRDGAPVFPILGADPTDPSNQQLPPTLNQDPAGLAPTLDQEALNRLLAREKQQGERAAVRRLVEQLGFTKAEDLTTFIKQQRDAQTAAMSELERREQAAAEATAAATQREAQALTRERAAARRAVLVGLGAPVTTSPTRNGSSSSTTPTRTPSPRPPRPSRTAAPSCSAPPPRHRP